MRPFLTPWPLNVDAYQAGHFTMIPPGMEDFQCSQAIFRKPLFPDDHRIISAGMAPFVALELQTPITQADIDEADWFYNDFNAGGTVYPWPKEIFQRVVTEFGGFLPVCVTGLLDGEAHYVGEPHAQVWSDVPGMGELVGWLESTMLPYLWTSSTVATRGRKRKDRMLEVFRKAYPDVTGARLSDMVAYKFHDFGRRGGASSQITGIAHLINWLGTDTMDAAYAATVYLNDRQKFGACSIIAAAHRTITPWPTERAAYDALVGKYRGNFFSVPPDSYNYEAGLHKLSGYADVVKSAGGTLIGRPDSGDPVESILKGLEILGGAFGISGRNAVGGRILQNAGIIQGDGVDDGAIFDRIYPAVVNAGWCPSNVAFGMGENNHKAVRSDTEEAYKTCMVGTAGGTWYRPVMKASEDLFKRSIPTPVAVYTEMRRDRVCTANVGQVQRGDTGDLVVQYDGRPKGLKVRKELFHQTRTRAALSWSYLSPVPEGDTFAPAIRGEQAAYMKAHR